MMMTTDPDLDALFADIARQTATPSDALRQRMLADAHAVLAPQLSAVILAPRGFAAFLGVFGGWPALGGLCACVAIGLCIGIWQPGFRNTDSVSLSFDATVLPAQID
jgi:hypothetical protein